MNYVTFLRAALCMPIIFLNCTMTAASSSSSTNNAQEAFRKFSAGIPPKKQSATYRSPQVYIQDAPPQADEIVGLIHVAQPTTYTYCQMPTFSSLADLDNNDKILAAKKAVLSELLNGPAPSCGGAAKMLAAARRLQKTPAHAKK